MPHDATSTLRYTEKMQVNRRNNIRIINLYNLCYLSVNLIDLLLYVNGFS